MPHHVQRSQRFAASSGLIGLLMFLPLALAGKASAQSPPPAIQSPGTQGGAPFTVVLDAAHGGQETGTLLNAQLTERDLVLSLSIRLRSALTARGMRVVTTRENNTNPSPETRATAANHAHAAACLILHATASGSGVHLYTSSLEQSPAQSPAHASASAGLVPWSSSGTPFTTDSLKLASEISTALASSGLPFTLGRVRLAPMDALNCPAVAVEIAPLRPIDSARKAAVAKIDDPDYTNQLVDALSAALVQWRAEHEHASGASR